MENLDPQNKNTFGSIGSNLAYGFCEVCKSSYLVSSQKETLNCPRCCKSGMLLMAGESPNLEELVIPTPEFFLPYRVSNSNLVAAWQRFQNGFWLHPVDLKTDNLHNRLSAVYLPIWLVDGSVMANWTAEGGFNYQVVSHKDRYNDRIGSWQSDEVLETRQRWELRAGILKRDYQNIPAPALEAHEEFMQRLGRFDYSSAKPFNSKEAFLNLDHIPYGLQLPDRKPEDAWLDAQPGFEKAASEECRQALGADFIRSYRWSPDYSDLNWTLNLLPVLTTYYLDDDGITHVLLLNGQNGSISGIRKASMKKARKMSIWLFLGGVFTFLLSLFGFLGGVFLPILFPLGLVTLVLAFTLGIGAVVPLLMVWFLNRNLPQFTG